MKRVITEKLPKVSEVNQTDIAEMIGISVDTLQNYKKLTELVPELQDWVETRVKIAPLIIRRANTNPI